MKKNLKKQIAGVMTACLVATSLAACGSSASDTTTAEETGAKAESNSAGQENSGETGSEGGGYKIGWSTIYLTPSWMQETNGLMEEYVE